MKNCFNYIIGILFWGLILENKLKTNKFHTKVMQKPVDNFKTTDKNIAIIDDFAKPSVFIDFDFEPDVSHGNVVKRLIEEGLPTAKIDCFDYGGAGIGAQDWQNTNIHLDEILTKIKDGKKYDAINLSLGNAISFEELSKDMDVNITPENVAQKKDVIKKWLNSPQSISPKIGIIAEIINKLDKLSEKKVQVYVAAGNAGKDSFNILTIVNGAKVVGCLEKDGSKDSDSADNSLVNDWKLGVLNVKKLTDSSGRSGFDYTGDGSIDIYCDQTTSFIKWSNPFDISGTSFSAPKALVDDLKKK